MDKRNRSVAISGPHLAQHPDLKFVVLLLLSLLGSAQAADLRVMKTGLGKGWINGPSISCGIVTTDAATDTDTIGTSCNATSTMSITLTARNHAGSTFGDGAVTAPEPAVPALSLSQQWPCARSARNSRSTQVFPCPCSPICRQRE